MVAVVLHCLQSQRRVGNTGDERWCTERCREVYATISCRGLPRPSLLPLPALLTPTISTMIPAVYITSHSNDGVPGV